ncbi:hypothetical protein GOA63_16430 [Sinorhizobium meliloti]|uniref:hypothetical protein n=1 Tax=Rhizobium meliloti TaxID=382 RepID=UPI001295C6E2|nr:hypothetical protein [Sinorhizobium meliloti]MDW9593793.1 hypothetical protein [Sinorhizobium meliloti]MDX0188865.1 hypothetical protein [Sinorhizobium meliloti]MQV10081.1 hypothetical protein [Sinorhizobium meliloti]MQV59237.1 hypothetical protein [Sinorhizobium meliloti]
MIDGPSWAELENAANSTPKKIIRELQLLSFETTPYEQFVTLVEKAINFSVTKMVSSKNIVAGKGGHRRMDEDQLTLLLSAPLLGMGFDISHSTNVGGNCDIHIQGPDDYLWLGEAKIFSDYGKLMGGFQQLCDRYSTGLECQSRGAMIIYMFGAKVQSMMKSWCDYLKDARHDLKTEPVDGQPLQFRTTELHRATEQPIVVCHMPVPLLHEPTDSAPPPPRTRRAEAKASRAEKAR